MHVQHHINAIYFQSTEYLSLYLSMFLYVVQYDIYSIYICTHVSIILSLSSGDSDSKN